MATQTPVDRGIAVITEDHTGASTVMVAAAVRNGRPQQVYAVHFKPASVQIAAGAAMRTAGTLRYSEKVVEVTADASGAVTIRPISMTLSV